MIEKQRTIARDISFSGIGLHTGNLTTITFKPAPPGAGITFYRVDVDGRPAIKADIDHVQDISTKRSLAWRGTTLGVNGVRIHTVEHVLAAVAGLGIDNLVVEIDANEPPGADGSALPFMAKLKEAGVVEQDAERQYVAISHPVYYRNGDVMLSILPADELRITMTIQFDHVAVGTQYASYNITPDVFEHEIAPARTFCFLREVKMLQEQGLIRGGSLESALVIGDEAILNDDLRFPDEFVRHKILDLLGDLFLLGRPIKGHIIGVKSGHAHHARFTQQIKSAQLNGHKRAAESQPATPRSQKQALDVNMIRKVLPHRYPFLLVDRILDYEPHKRVVGIKNVTVNEPFFQGHWPHFPVMPAVLIVESMAQVSSVLVLNELSEPGRAAFFLSIDNARFRRTVVPGDQLVIESRMLRMRRNACKVHAVATVDGSVAAEADMMFGLMDAGEAS